MKKILISLVLALVGFTNLYAAKAKPGIVKLTLQDGTIVSATLSGDENFHYYALLDGTPLSKNADGKYVVSTASELQTRCQQARARKLTTRASAIGKTTPAYFPHTGSPKALVILVQFPDVKFKSSDPVATFNHYLNADFGTAAPSQDAQIFIQNEEYTNYGSVREYFKDGSLGKFTPEFDIVGPVTVSQESAYYGKDKGDDTDTNFRQMISEACALVDDQVDFSKYDNDNDKFVDLVYIIYAGYSQSISGNSDDYLWPKSGTDNFYKYDANGKKITPQEYLIYDGMRICRYGINNELNASPVEGQKRYALNGIGLFCHEFSHTMGLPDFYDTDYHNADNQSPEFWDLMDAGEYTADGYRPTPYTPWEKMMMGWVDPTTLDGSQAQQLTLEPYDKASQAYKIDADVNDDNFRINENYADASTLTDLQKQKLLTRAKGEYLLLQNIRNEGWYKELPGYGMLVWRIDYADKTSVQLNDEPNNDVGIPRITIVPADSLVISQFNCGEDKNAKYTYSEYSASLRNDPFPAYGIAKDGGNINSLTTVNFNWSTMTTRPLYNIVKDEATGMVTFDYLKDFSATGIKQAITDNVSTDNRPVEYFDLEGRKIKTPQKGHLYVTNKGKKMIY